jgi:hypothetical protein
VEEWGGCVATPPLKVDIQTTIKKKKKNKQTNNRLAPSFAEVKHLFCENIRTRRKEYKFINSVLYLRSVLCFE